MPAEPSQVVIQYPGAIRVRMRWAGSNQAAAVFALSEVGGALTDHGSLVSTAPDLLCRAELRVETPAGAWTARLASPIFDEPTGSHWDTAGLLVVGYGFVTYGFEARTGALRWSHRSGTPLIAQFASSRLAHILVQSELETFALEPDGQVGGRVTHSDVVVGAELVGGSLVLASFSGQQNALDPATGRRAGGPAQHR
jgi:outer membrane protein assembly factor BamB